MTPGDLAVELNSWPRARDSRERRLLLEAVGDLLDAAAGRLGERALTACSLDTPFHGDLNIFWARLLMLDFYSMWKLGREDGRRGAFEEMGWQEPTNRAERRLAERHAKRRQKRRGKR